MQTISKSTWFKASAVAGLLLPVVLVTGCGGGGSGTSTPSTAFVGTYQGTFAFPSAGEGQTGSFTLRVQTSGQATGVFNEEDPTRTLSTAGTVNLSTGAIALSATNADNGTTNSTVTVSGTATSNTSSGSVVVTDSDGTQNGTFTAPKTSNTILPTATPVATSTGQLKRHSTSGKKVGGGK